VETLWKQRRPRAHALAAWEAENKRRVKDADDPDSLEFLMPLTLHEARHSAVSYLLDAGLNDLELTGWSGTATCARRRTSAGTCPRTRTRRGSHARHLLRHGHWRRGLTFPTTISLVRSAA
jgi:hypothetical protein